MFYEQRGPLVFSASLHLALLVGVAIWLMVSPSKDPKEFEFELVPPPSGGFARSTAEVPLEPLETIKFERAPLEMPSLEDIVLPEREPIVVEVEMPPEPTPQTVEQPVVEVAAPTPKPMTWEEFQQQNKDANKRKNVRTTPPPTQQRPQIDLTKDLVALKNSLNQFSISSLPSAEIASYSTADQAALSGYISGFKSALKRNVADHPIRGAKLSALVSCDIAANGRVTNVRIIRSSGDAVFDRKILDGYSRIANFNAPPKRDALMGLQIEFIQ